MLTIVNGEVVARPGSARAKRGAGGATICHQFVDQTLDREGDQGTRVPGFRPLAMFEFNWNMLIRSHTCCWYSYATFTNFEPYPNISCAKEVMVTRHGTVWRWRKMALVSDKTYTRSPFIFLPSNMFFWQLQHPIFNMLPIVPKDFHLNLSSIFPHVPTSKIFPTCRVPPKALAISLQVQGYGVGEHGHSSGRLELWSPWHPPTLVLWIGMNREQKHQKVMIHRGI